MLVLRKMLDALRPTVYISVAVTALLLLSACAGKTVEHSYQALPLQGWRQGDTLVFATYLPDSAACYHLSVGIRHTASFAYRELWLQLLAPELGAVTDTLRLPLADEWGHWTSQGWGGLYQSRVAAGSFCADSAGVYTFGVVHLMPDTLLLGVSDVGLLVRRAP